MDGSPLAVRNGGTFALTSGDMTYVRYKKGGWRPREEFWPHANWLRTLVTIILDLANLLPIGEVYRSLPLPHGYKKEDFFEPV